ncbi:MAG TPA: hypothetical protein VER33_28095 [Polyangiaceae bacterium]|nr:hypothetical protein [Polyangiaceae bacterium]
MRHLGLPFAVGLLLSSASSARAELPPNGQPFESRDFTIDLAQTAIIAGTRVTGLAGAFVAVAEGVDGAAQNPAAVAARDPWSATHVDYDLGLGLTFSSAFEDADFFNSGRRTLTSTGGSDRFVFLNLAANLQIGRWGFGVAADIQEYSLERLGSSSAETQADRLLAELVVTHITLAYAAHDGEWLLGIGNRSSSFDVVNANDPEGAPQALFQALGAGWEAGFLLRPNDAQYRIGVSVRTAVSANATPDSRGVLYEDDPENRLVLPQRVTLPWDVHAGVAVQLGPRPFNPRWLDPVNELSALERYLEWRGRERARRRAHELQRLQRAGLDLEWAARALDAELASESALDELHLERARTELQRRLAERYRGMERFYVLLTGSLELLGAVDDGVGVESFLERRVQRSGRDVSWSPRLGVESEVIPHWTRVRSGVYLEPSRFRDNSPGARPHWTLGLDQRLFASELFGLLGEGSTFRASGSLDTSRSYFSWSVAAGMWH